MGALRIAVTGSTGLIGTALVQELRARGHRVVRLVRQAPAGGVEQWEVAAGQAAEAGVRVVTMRAGVVVSRHGGILARLLPPFRLGLGARLGSGTQAMSWITLADYAAIVSFLLAHPEISG